MDAPAFFELVKDSFEYLVREYGFVVVKEVKYPYFDCAEVLFQSADFRIRAGRDRGSFYVDVSSLASPEDWWGLPTIVAYITEGAVRG